MTCGANKSCKKRALKHFLAAKKLQAKRGGKMTPVAKKVFRVLARKLKTTAC